MTQTSASAGLEIVLAYHRAWTSGDLDEAMTRVADDIVCRAPGVDLVGKDSYRAYLADFVPNVTGLTDVASFADADHVALFYYPHTVVTSSAPAAEYVTIRDDKIVQSVLLFDRLSFVPSVEQ